MGALSIILVSMRDHEEFHFTLSDQGLKINSTLYEFENMISFSIIEYIDPSNPPILSIRTKSILSPEFIIPLTNVDPIEVYEFFEDQVDFDTHHEGVVDRAVDFLGL